MIRRLVYTVKLGLALGLHTEEIEFRGKCGVADCGFWVARYQGCNYHLPERTYNRLLFIRRMNAR